MLFNGTSKIIRDEKLLSIDFIPKHIIGREKEIKDLAFNFSYFFRENPTLPKLTIYGTVGTGKTAVCNYIMNEFKDELQKKNSEEIFKIIKIRCSESKTKYEILKNILTQIEPNIKTQNTKSEVYSQIINLLAEKGWYILIFIDEIHELDKKELNDTIYTISRFGEDLMSVVPKIKIFSAKKSQIGYIFISNDMNLRTKLKDNTKSSFTQNKIFFNRYGAEEISLILLDRIKQGALVENTINEGVINLVSGLSVQEGQDARYALMLLSNVSKEAEKKI